MAWPRVSSLKTIEQFQARLSELEIDLPVDEHVEAGTTSILSQPMNSVCGPIGNRWCILPMEGWDGTTDGRPSDLTRRRWRNFGLSGAKLIWGGEAVAVRQDGRANPNQLLINDHTVSELSELLRSLKLHTGSSSDRRTIWWSACS